MDTFNKDQFNKLTNEEKGKIIGELVLHPLEIICKSKDELFIVKPFSIKPILKLFIRFLQKEPSLTKGEEIIGQFLHNKQNLYIFKCDFSREASHPVLILNSDFYMIQRRENYRVTFPSSLHSKVLIKSTEYIMIGRVADLSRTGIRVGSKENPEILQVGAEIEMEIQVLGHQPLFIRAQVRHRTESTEMVKEKKLPYYFFGFQFIDISIENEKSLSRINMELYRNFFQKVNS